MMMTKLNKIVLSLALGGLCLGNALAQQTAGANFGNVPNQIIGGSPTAGVSFEAPQLPAYNPLDQFNPKPIAKPPIDPLAISSAAVKKTPAPSISLPGVLSAPENANALDFNKTRVIELSTADNPTIYLSVDDINRITLPFNPRVINGDGITTKVSNNNLYVNFNEGVTHSVQVFLENPNSSATLGLQLVPKRISSQTIIVQDSVGAGGVNHNQAALKGNDYQTNVQGIMESLALGANPQGFSKQVLDYPPVAENGYVVQPLNKYSGSDKDIFVYEVANPNAQQITLRESDFDGPTVLAMSIFPTPIIQPGSRVKVFVIARKNSARSN